MPVLDVFHNSMFSITALTDTLNNQPFAPGRIGQLIDWNESGIRTTTVMIEIKNGVLAIVNPSPRGGVGDAIPKTRREGRALAVPHYQIDDGINADEVQGIREFGQESSVMSVRSYVDDRMAELRTDLDITLEYQRLGAIKGVILNGDGSTLYNLFTEFGVTQEAEIDFDLDNASPASGALRKKVAQVVRTISDNTNGARIDAIYAICGNAFFDDLLAHVEVRASYLGTEMAKVLRDGYVLPNDLKIYGAFEFGGIVWENYRGSYNSTAFVETDKCYIFPLGPGLYKTVFAPADYIETVNTVGLPRYAKQYDWLNDKGVALELQTNALSYMKRPKALIKGKRT